MGTGTSSHGRERGQGGNRGHSKHTHDKEGNIEVKEKKRKSEVESISSLKKLNEELKEKLKKQGRAADKMGEEYSKLRGKLRKCKREKEDLEAEIETLKQRNKDLAMMVGSRDLLKDCQAESQGCHSEFGSNKVRKMVRQGKEKRLLARIFKILGKARKRLSRQNSTIKVRKCEEKRPEFTKKARKRLSRQNSTRKVRKCEEK